jgi:hypothetical protein
MEKRNWLELARELVPANWKKIDHPMGSEEEARELLASLPVWNPLASLNEVVNWLESVAAEHAFSPERRARIVMLLDEAVQPHWRLLTREYLAPNGEPAEGKDGDPNLLRRFGYLAGALVVSYHMVFGDDIPRLDWDRREAALLLTRWARALMQTTAVHRMLREPMDTEVWSALNGVLERARRLKVDRAVITAYEGEKNLTCVRLEYLRAILFSIAAPESLKARDLELVLRIAGRFAASVQLLDAPLSTCAFGIDPGNASGPVVVERLGRHSGVLFLDTSNCIAQMKTFANLGRVDAAETIDTHFGGEFTARERSRMLKHALICWGPHPPKRKTNRIGIGESVRITNGLAMALELCGIYDQGGFSIQDGGLRIQFDDKEGAEKLAAERIRRERLATLDDASTSGLGLSLPRADTSWARIGELVSVFVQPGPDWAVCAARRVTVRDDTLSLGLEVLARRPRSAWLRVLESENESVWDESMRRERNFDSHYVHGLLLSDLPQTEAAFGEMLLPPGRATPGVSFDLPLPGQVLRLSVVDVREAGEDYVRVRVRWRQTVRAESAGQTTKLP